MKLRNLLILDAIVSLLFAIGLLLGPSTILQFFGLTTGNTEKLLAQVLGAGLAGFGLLSWFTMNFADMKAREGAVISLLVFSAIGFVVTLLGELAKVSRAGSAWLVVVIFLFFTVGLAYFQFLRPGGE